MGHTEFQIYKNILVLTKILKSGHFTYTHDLKYAVKHDMYLEQLVPWLCVSRTHVHTTHTHTHTLQNPDNLDQQTGNGFLLCVPATRAATADNTAQIKSTLFKKCQSVSKILLIVKWAICSMAAENGLEPM